MALFAILSVPMLASAAVIRDLPNVLHSRQANPFGITGNLMSLTPKAPVQIKKLSPDINQAAVREAKIYGPFMLKPSNATHDSVGTGMKLDSNSDIFSSLIQPLCTDCMILAVQAEMVFQNGTRADIGNGVYGHHIMTTDIGRQMIRAPISVVCNGKKTSFGEPPMKKRQALGAMFGFPASPLIAKGGESFRTIFAALNSTINSGFYVAKNDLMFMSAEIVNYDPVPKELYLSLDVEYIPGHPTGYLDVGHGGINVEGCKGAGPPGSQGSRGPAGLALYPPADRPITYTSPEWIIDGDGYLVNFTPHLHDGALNIRVYYNGALVCTSNAIYGGANGGTLIDGKRWETITSYTPCSKAIQVKKGDKLTMTSDYDLTKHRLRPNSMNHDMGQEAMAVANFVFAKAA